MFKKIYILVLIFCFSCKQTEGYIDITNTWLKADEPIEVISNYLGTDNICMSFQEDGVLYIRSDVTNEFLNYTIDEFNIYSIDGLGKVSFIKVEDGYSANFKSLFIDDNSHLFVGCHPY